MKVTTLMAKQMREDRKAGMLLKLIAYKYGVGIGTVQRHTSKASHSLQRRMESDRYWKRKEDPVKYRAYLDRCKESSRRYRESLRNPEGNP